jgi:hypothetical protein
VNTDCNCSFNISALLLLSLCRNPILFFNGGNSSPFLTLAFDKTSLHCFPVIFTILCKE